MQKMSGVVMIAVERKLTKRENGRELHHVVELRNIFEITKDEKETNKFLSKE